MAFVDTHPPKMTTAQFLAWEEQQPDKWELVDGRPRMMVGGTLRHYRVAVRVTSTLSQRLRYRRSKCEALPEGVKVTTPSGDTFYPDALILCSSRSGSDRSVDDPTVVVEVLSPSTAAFDRGAKWRAYQEIPMLTHYVLVSQDEPRIEVFSRVGVVWEYRSYVGLDAGVPLDAVGISLDLAEIYADLPPDDVPDTSLGG